jgi:hypothetical protein
MRLVEHRGVHRRQQFGHAAVAQRHVGEEQVVVDDHQVGRHGFAPRLHHVAGRNSGQSVPRQLSRVEVTSGITGDRSSRPSISARSPLRVALRPGSIRASARTAKRSGSCGPPGAPACACSSRHAAQVAGAALQQRHAHRHAQRMRRRGRSRRKSWSCRLLVAVDTSARAPTAAAAPGRRRSCRRRCRPRPPAPRADVDGLRHAPRPARPAAARGRKCGSLRARAPSSAKAWATASSDSGPGMRFVEGQADQAGSGGSTWASSCAISSRSRSRRFLSRRSVRSSGAGRRRGRSGLSRSACSMRSSMSRRCGECRFSSMLHGFFTTGCDEAACSLYSSDVNQPRNFVPFQRRHRFAPRRPQLPAGPG